MHCARHAGQCAAHPRRCRADAAAALFAPRCDDVAGTATRRFLQRPPAPRRREGSAAPARACAFPAAAACVFSKRLRPCTPLSKSARRRAPLRRRHGRRLRPLRRRRAGASRLDAACGMRACAARQSHGHAADAASRRRARPSLPRTATAAAATTALAAGGTRGSAAAGRSRRGRTRPRRRRMLRRCTLLLGARPTPQLRPVRRPAQAAAHATR